MNAHVPSITVFQDEVANHVESGEPISSLQNSTSKVRVSNPRSPWVHELAARFDKLTSLRRGWDGYSGSPVSFTCAQFAANIIERLFIPSLPAPQLVPVSDGTVRLEWHMNQYDLEVEVLAPYEVIAFRSDLISGKEEEIEIEMDFSELSCWVAELAAPRNGNAHI